MPLANPDEETTYTPGSVPGVDVPREEEDTSNVINRGKDNVINKTSTSNVIGAKPSASTTKIEKPDLGGINYSVYYDASGRHILPEPPPITRDYSAMITSALNRLQNATSARGVVNLLTQSAVSFMAIPEFVSMINDLNTSD